MDYGPRAFRVVTDEHLTLHVAGQDGRVLARPPKPGTKDTRPEAYQQFLQLKKDVRATALAQTGRLEGDMLARRLRPAGDIPQILLPHPILGPIARRLLWGEYDPPRRLVRPLRIAEDGTFADIHDATAAVEPDAPLGIVHPADLGRDLPAWAQLFVDYEVLQPFPQVHRPAVILSEAQRAATSLKGLPPVPTERLERLLLSVSWQGNRFHTGNGLHTQLTHQLPGGLALVVNLHPGVAASVPNTVAEQQITEVWIDHTWSDHWQLARRLSMGSCDQAALSELLVELDPHRA
jgi:hypothetical protein